MLEEFANNGLVDIATDYALILLPFTNRGLENMEVAPPGSPCGRRRCPGLLVAANLDNGRRTGILRQPVRAPPLAGHAVRPQIRRPAAARPGLGQHPDAKRTIRDEATVDYALSTHGFLMPVSVVHRHLVDGQLKTENLYRYEPFKLFSADAEIKFTEVPETPPPPPNK